jgi:hypothetical protein
MASLRRTSGPPARGRLPSPARILGNAPRPRFRHCDDLRGLFPALRAAHPLRELLESHGPADEARKDLGLNLTTRAAVTNHTHQELAEAIVQFLDVREHAHERMVLTRPAARACSTGERLGLYGRSAARSSLCRLDVCDSVLTAIQTSSTVKSSSGFASCRPKRCNYGKGGGYCWRSCQQRCLV